MGQFGSDKLLLLDMFAILLNFSKLSTIALLLFLYIIRHLITNTFFMSQLQTPVIARCFSSMDKDYLVVNAVGPDRVGIVSGLTKMVVDKGGNVGESQASRLGSHFGLMMLVSVPKKSSQELQTSLKELEGMSTSCYTTDDPNAVQASPGDGCKF